MVITGFLLPVNTELAERRSFRTAGRFCKHISLMVDADVGCCAGVAGGGAGSLGLPEVSSVPGESPGAWPAGFGE